MTTNYRALCAELAGQLNEAVDLTDSIPTRGYWKLLVGRAHLALAENPQAPMDEEVRKARASAGH
jgi:hypothetical protein